MCTDRDQRRIEPDRYLGSTIGRYPDGALRFSLDVSGVGACDAVGPPTAPSARPSSLGSKGRPPPRSHGGLRTCNLAGGVAGGWRVGVAVGLAAGPTRPVSSRPGTVPAGAERPVEPA